MNSRAPRQSAEQWSDIITEYERSGLDVQEFCSRRGFATSTFNRWRWRFSRHTGAMSRSAKNPVATAFVEAMPTGSEPIVICLGEDIRLECPLEMGIVSIVQLLQALRQHERV